ncbi:hypothetical protein Desti_0118 [Desulfomonile tiedjei DSM 6799]|uniref:Uncharacterized protein n=1 Tax=Desulfomonile tiedjei (strain ATCC 49306 / DSM 6799 / DCB-1) TaxID=706587 RepID=I4BZX5_DESTA|nr:hypothetical protein Desti_0118 [Desulfomonile tiedjei DSM 6799]
MIIRHPCFFPMNISHNDNENKTIASFYLSRLLFNFSYSGKALCIYRAKSSDKNVTYLTRIARTLSIFHRSLARS